MAIFKTLSAADVKTSRSTLNQLVDIVQADISSSQTRQSFQVFVTGGVGPGITSSMFQTVYDQDFSLQTANPMFDMTVGLFAASKTVLSNSSGEDANGKLLFPSESVMAREKVDIYRQFAQLLAGDASTQFFSPPNSSDITDGIDEALFISFKRLFHRDKIKKETFALKFFTSASAAVADDDAALGATGQSNLNRTSFSGSMIITDIGAASNQITTFGGPVGALVDSANTNERVGLVYYNKGMAILDLKKVTSGSQLMSGTIDAMAVASTIDAATIPAGKTVLGSTVGNPEATFIPDVMMSASMDDIVDHIAACRFQSGSALSALTFQNQTNINSTLFFCRATADEFNYSSNPTFIDTNNKIVVIETGNEDTQRSFTMPTGVGLFDARSNLLAVAKLSRPIEKNDEKDITIRVRLDF